jgi:uncharacterized pyridoxamine 5'-phosphate oxidase family protein
MFRMKWTLFIFVLLFSACAELARYPAAKSETRHVVFDIDWTIVSELKEGHFRPSKRIIEVDGKKYFISEGLVEFITNILNKKDVKISFFSGGKHDRNMELLQKIKLSDNRSLNEIAYKILSFEDLVSVDSAVGAPFGQRYKKDLAKVTTELDQLVMFDDVDDFVLETKVPQSDNVFFIGSTFEYFESFKDTDGLTGKYIPKSYEQWLLNNKKLYILNVAFEQAYLESKSGNITFSEAMKRKEIALNLKSHEWNDLSDNYYEIYFKTERPKSIQEPFKCTENIKLLMGF